MIINQQPPSGGGSGGGSAATLTVTCNEDLPVPEEQNVLTTGEVYGTIYVYDKAQNDWVRQISAAQGDIVLAKYVYNDDWTSQLKWPFVLYDSNPGGPRLHEFCTLNHAGYTGVTKGTMTNKKFYYQVDYVFFTMPEYDVSIQRYTYSGHSGGDIN